MRSTLDFAPLFRTSIGFDRMLDALESASRAASLNGGPPYDIVRIGDDSYRISMAVAGFTRDDLTITQERNMLMVAGKKPGEGEEDGQYLHRGIAGQAFERRFELADHVKVVDANLANGLLTIELERDVPEEMKPRRIAITTSGTPPKVEARQIETGKEAA